MAIYRIRLDPRTSAGIERLLALLQHIEAFGLTSSALATRITSGGQIDLTTVGDLPDTQLAHLGVEKV